MAVADKVAGAGACLPRISGRSGTTTRARHLFKH